MQYEAVVDLLINSATPHTKQRYLKALGFVQTDVLMERALEFAMIPHVSETRESYVVFEALTTHKAGKQKLWDWFKTHTKEIEKAFEKNRDGGGRIIQICTKGLGTRAQLEDVKAWFEGHETKVNNYTSFSCCWRWSCANNLIGQSLLSSTVD